MDSNLEKILHQRVVDNECIICEKNLEKNNLVVVLTHSVLGEVLICESHIKQSGNDA